ncbi:hypothetical protein PV11_06564 [Exophiala sideris]|uniref:Uncharacterized protein n=1 Tax=Exophiala sideris TaxID=1016849 RepID=A0A0D1WUT7_9EURO|nr:hypothetical protein PV11_06564 [Exophiala sideris]
MATSHSEKHSDVSTPEQGTSQTYHVGEKATQPAPPKRRDSKLGHVMDSLRRSFSTEHKGSLERKSSQHEAHLEKVRERDSIDRARAAEEMMWESAETKESTSPAVEARKSFDLNENNMGADSEQRKEQLGLAWVGDDR